MKKFFRKFIKEKRAVPQMPEWNEIVKMLYDKNLDCFDDEIVRVIYSKDKAMRYIVLKSGTGFFSYRLEKIYQLDEEEWSYRCSFDLTPAFWQDVDYGNKSIFSTLEDALNELKQEAEYKFFRS
ncbi:MAG: hypothetical protein E7413_00260 [Ruminococcaceae bacterium]|nr:hypothetical protein [Oscillospiraceae bacterium]